MDTPVKKGGMQVISPLVAGSSYFALGKLLYKGGCILVRMSH